MNQPKFKFGDKITFGANPKVKDIFGIKKEMDGFYYCAIDTDWISEGAVKLYQEPKKKMLYAFKCRDTKWVGLTDEPLRVRDGNFDRVPEYDIDYQSQNYSPNGLQDINSRARG